MLARRFLENIASADGKNLVLEFTPLDSGPIPIACLWSDWSDPTGQQGDRLSSAAITNHPEPEVAAAGTYRSAIKTMWTLG